MDIAGKVAIVTGAGSGIGRATSVALARQGASVGVLDVDEAGGSETVREIEDGGGVAMFVLTDVTDASSVAAGFGAVAERFGGVDIVHNNAGLVSGSPDFPEQRPERGQLLVMVNLGGVVVGTLTAIPLLRSRGGGVIVNTASITGLFPFAMDPVYGATKAGVLSFTKACAGLAESDNIRVNAVVPGGVNTPILNKTGDGTKPAAWFGDTDRSTMTQPEDIAAGVLSLIQDDAQIGETLVIAPELAGMFPEG